MKSKWYRNNLHLTRNLEMKRNGRRNEKHIINGVSSTATYISYSPSRKIEISEANAEAPTERKRREKRESYNAPASNQSAWNRNQAASEMKTKTWPERNNQEKALRYPGMKWNEMHAHQAEENNHSLRSPRQRNFMKEGEKEALSAVEKSREISIRKWRRSRNGRHQSAIQRRKAPSASSSKIIEIIGIYQKKWHLRNQKSKYQKIEENEGKYFPLQPLQCYPRRRRNLEREKSAKRNEMKENPRIEKEIIRKRNEATSMAITAKMKNRSWQKIEAAASPHLEKNQS